MMMTTYNELIVLALTFILWSVFIYIAGTKKGALVVQLAVEAKLKDLELQVLRDKFKEVEHARSNKED